MSDDKWEGEVVDTSGELSTGEEIRDIMNEIVKREKEAIHSERSVPVNPLQYRDMLVVHGGCSKEKANEITLGHARKQGSYTKEDVQKLKEALEK